MRFMSLTSLPTIHRAAMPALGLFVLLAAPFSAITLDAADTPVVVNAVCPMSGKPVDPSVKMVMMTLGEGADAKHYNVAFCSHECCVKFEKDPGAALKPWFIGPKGGDTRKGQ